MSLPADQSQQPKEALSVLPGSTHRIEFVHALRGIAAFSVIIAHLFGVFWAQPAEVEKMLNVPALAVSMPSYFLALHFSPHFNYGAFGVALFFLISGFIIPFSLAKQSRRGFLVARVFRIYPVYMLSLALGVITVWLMDHYVSGRAFSHTWQQLLPQFLLVKPAIDQISWTLRIELLFYLACVLLYKPMTKWGNARVLMSFVVAASVGCIVAAAFLDSLSGGLKSFLTAITYALPFITYMMIGSFFYHYYRKTIGLAQLVSGATIALFGFHVMVAANAALSDFSTNSYLLALGVFVLFYAGKESFRTTKILTYLADISFPLYAVHPLIGYSWIYLMYSNGMNAFFSALSAVVVVMLVATAIHFTVEIPTQRKGKALSVRWFPRSKH